jgi:hypothetical protein
MPEGETRVSVRAVPGANTRLLEARLVLRDELSGSPLVGHVHEDPD